MRILVFDSMSRIWDGASFPGAEILVYGSNLACCLLNPVIAFFFARYCEGKRNVDERRRRRSLVAPCLAMGVHTLLSMLLFIRLQNARIATDALTGMNNRGRMRSYPDWKVRHLKEDCRLYALMPDMGEKTCER